MQTVRQTVRVWDPFVRVFHWSLVAAYAAAWVTAEAGPSLHEQIGYFVLALLGLRVVWGLIGTRHARFGDFIYSPRRTLDYLRSMLTGRPSHYLGHNPAGGWMVVALMLSLLGTGLSGVMMGGVEDGLWEEVHEGLASLTLLLVFLHVGGVALASLLHGENLVKAMLTGRKRGEAQNV